MEHLPNQQTADRLCKLQDRIAEVSRSQSGSISTDLGDKEVMCEEHGPYMSRGTRFLKTREIWSRCPDCEEARIARERQDENERKAAAEVARLKAMIEEAAIPPRFIGRGFDNFKAEGKAQEAALTVCRSYAENFEQNFKRGAGLILSGLPGTGKSHLAAAILQGIMPAYCGWYTTCMTVIRNVRNTWRRDSEKSETEVLRFYRDLPLLVIDEIGVQYGTDGEQTILFDLLDSRYRDMKPTILLTNQDKAGFKAYIGDRSFDRLTETSRWVSFDWASYRPTARKEAA